MKSIIQKDPDRCYLCGRSGTSADPLDTHHVFFGPYRSKSERYGLTVRLHHFSCHIFGPDSVHVNAKVCRTLQAEVQEKAMRHYGLTAEDFIGLFGRNYVEENANEQDT